MRPLLIMFLLLTLAACGAVQSAGPTPAPTLAPAARGAVLFANRGCNKCHVHSALGESEGHVPVGPNLTSYSADEAWLREWLINPAAVRPGTPMPTLGLDKTEIDALVAFLLS